MPPPPSYVLDRLNFGIDRQAGNENGSFPLSDLLGIGGGFVDSSALASSPSPSTAAVDLSGV